MFRTRLLAPSAFAMFLLVLLLGGACSSDTSKAPEATTTSESAAVSSAAGGDTGAIGERVGELDTGTGSKVETTPGSANRVALGPAAFRTARILTEEPRLGDVGAASGGLEVTGQVELDPARVALVSPRSGGRLERLLVVAGDRVGAGQTVALVQSAAFTTAQNDVLQASRRLAVLRGSSDEAGARALLDAARRRLALLGVRERAIEALEAGGAPSALLPVTAPFSGSIIETPALAGQAVDAGTPLYKIADLSVVNVAANVPERALSAVRVGQSASIRVVGAPQSAVIGRVTRISDVLDPEKRTAEALIRVPNANRALKAGMFATVNLRGLATATTHALTIPASAIITDGADRYVFVQVDERAYERRPVELAASIVAGGGTASARVTVVSGLDAGDRVVVRGAFTLKSELAKASLVDED